MDEQNMVVIGPVRPHIDANEENKNKNCENAYFNCSIIQSSSTCICIRIHELEEEDKL